MSLYAAARQWLEDLSERHGITLAHSISQHATKTGKNGLTLELTQTCLTRTGREDCVEED